SVAAGSPADRRTRVIALVRERITRELGFPELIDTRQPLSEVGLDSLMSVNVANRLETALGLPVPLVKLIRGPSIEQLVDELFPASAPLAGGHVEGADSSRAGARSRTSSDGWLVFPRPVAAPRARLFCFPFAGAGATAFRAWAEALPAALELVAVAPPGPAGPIAEPPGTRAARPAGDERQDVHRRPLPLAARPPRPALRVLRSLPGRGDRVRECPALARGARSDAVSPLRLRGSPAPSPGPRGRLRASSPRLSVAAPRLRSAPSRSRAAG